MKKILCLSICVVCLLSFNFVANADGDIEVHKIYIDDIEVNINNPIIKKGQDVLIPFRAIMEALNSNVVWDAESGNTSFDYMGVEYISQIKYIGDDLQQFKTIHICRKEFYNSKLNDNYLQLSPWDSTGFYELINNRIYFYELAGIRLLQELENHVEFDAENMILKITTPRA